MKLGEWERAGDVCSRILSLTNGRIHYGDIYVKTFYRLGKVAEERGDTQEAVEQYKKFLELWQDADPGIQEVEEAGIRLQALNLR